MQLAEEVEPIILLDYGFEKIEKEENDEEFVINSFDYKYEIGHSRRGQFYYLLVKEKDRKIIIYASKPDGSGGSVQMPNILLKMMLDRIIIPSP